MGKEQNFANEIRIFSADRTGPQFIQIWILGVSTGLNQMMAHVLYFSNELSSFQVSVSREKYLSVKHVHTCLRSIRHPYQNIEQFFSSPISHKIFPTFRGSRQGCLTEN